MVVVTVVVVVMMVVIVVSMVRKCMVLSISRGWRVGTVDDQEGMSYLSPLRFGGFKTSQHTR